MVVLECGFGNFLRALMVKRLGEAHQKTSCGESMHVTCDRGTFIEGCTVDLVLLKVIVLSIVVLMSVRTFNRISNVIRACSCLVDSARSRIELQQPSINPSLPTLYINS